MPITGIAYVDLLVHPSTVSRWITTWEAFGFTQAGTIRTPDTDGYTFRRPGGAQLIISVANPGSAAARHLGKYGEGVRDIAFFTPDVHQTYTEMIRAGATPIFETGWTLGGSQIAVAGGAGRLRHTILQTPAPYARSTPPSGFDHVAVTVPAGEMTRTHRFYTAAGFTWEPGVPIGDPDDGMAMGVLTAGTAVLTLTSPDPRNPGLEHFLGVNGGVPAVHHLGLLTPDISRTIDEINSGPSGVLWVPGPPGWGRQQAIQYRGLPDLHLLIDRGVITGPDTNGRVLRQVLTRPLVDGCGIYTELIQRRDPLGGPPAEGFGQASGVLLAEAKAAACTGRALPGIINSMGSLTIRAGSALLLLAGLLLTLLPTGLTPASAVLTATAPTGHVILKAGGGTIALATTGLVGSHVYAGRYRASNPAEDWHTDHETGGGLPGGRFGLFWAPHGTQTSKYVHGAVGGAYLVNNAPAATIWTAVAEPGGYVALVYLKGGAQLSTFVLTYVGNGVVALRGGGLPHPTASQLWKLTG